MPITSRMIPHEKTPLTSAELRLAISTLAESPFVELRNVAEHLKGQLHALEIAEAPKSGRHRCIDDEDCRWEGDADETTLRTLGYPSLHDRDCPRCGSVAPTVEDHGMLLSHLGLGRL